MDKTERRRKFIINIAFWAIIVAFLIFFLRRFINVLMPFVVAFIVAALVKPASIWAAKNLHIPRNAAAVIAVIVFYLLLCGLLLIIASQAVDIVRAFASKVPRMYTDSIEPAVRNAANYLKSIGDEAFGDDFDAVVTELLVSLGGLATSLSAKLLTWVTSAITNVPGLMLDILICVIATLFAASDWPHIQAFISAQIPENQKHLMRSIKDHFKQVIGSYLRSYSIILSITFIEVSLGVMLIGYDHAFLIGLGVAIFDILPILGTGMIVIPWSIITALSGNFMNGLWLFLLWCFITIVRNYLEPKIVGKQVGLHPLVTLMSMVVGTYLFGGIGLFGLPISIAVLVSLRSGGLIRLYNDVPEETIRAKEQG